MPAQRKDPAPEAVLEKCLGILSEHFEAAQIMVSRLQPDGCTEFYFKGSGNWFARKGMAQEFLNQQIAKNIADAMPENESED